MTLDSKVDDNTYDDRRALLGVYASNQTQFAALTVAMAAGFLAEVNLYFQIQDANAFTNELVHEVVFGLGVSTIFLAAVVLNAYIETRGIVQQVLWKQLPTTKKEVLLLLGDAKKYHIELENVESWTNSGIFDAYYVLNARKKRGPSWFNQVMWIGLPRVLTWAVVILVVSSIFARAVFPLWGF